MKAEIVEIVYSVSAWGTPYCKGWAYMGQRNTLEEARERQRELRKKYSRVKITEHKRTATVVI